MPDTPKPFRNHLAAAEINTEITSPETSANLNKLVDRMEAITGQFRFSPVGAPIRKPECRSQLCLKKPRVEMGLGLAITT